MHITKCKFKYLNFKNTKTFIVLLQLPMFHCFIGQTSHTATTSISCDIQTFLNQFLSPEILSSKNEAFLLNARLFLRAPEKSVLQFQLSFLQSNFVLSQIRVVSQINVKLFFSCTQTKPIKHFTVLTTFEDEFHL